MSEPTNKSNDRDRLLSSNLAAYERLRKQGLHPPSIDKAGVLERRATSQFEIDAGHLYKNDEEKKRVKDAVQELVLKDMGVA